MKISDEKAALIDLYRRANFLERMKIYARIIFNFEQIKKHLDRYIPESGTVLDYGCGYGIFSNYIKMKKPNLKVIGFDISTTRISEAKKTTERLGVEFTDEIANFQPNDLKLVLIVDVLLFIAHHEKVKLLNKIYNLLETEGILFIKDTLKSDSLRFKYTKFEEKLKLKLRIYGRNVKSQLDYITPSEFVNLLTGTGFKVLEIIPEVHFVYPGLFIVAQK